MYDTNRKSFLNKNALKKDTLRFNEYYGMQPTFDNLYKQSLSGSKFSRLYDIITSDENIMLAYRNIKGNKGSKTSGTNRRTIKHVEKVIVGKLTTYIKKRLENYQPQKVRRVEIPKSNGKTRPLGIPCIEDRIIQQCLKQVLEPICEAKFHKHSYGFRPNRSTEHAVAYLYKKVNIDKCYYMVDVDIKGFFDNVCHGKLLKQLWSMGIRDKRVLSIISKMLKAEVEGIGIPDKGVPQGGILSPLLSNVVLNELDWWISDQWETFETKHQYKHAYVKYDMLRKSSNMKEMYIIRYADDFKVVCRNKITAKKTFIAVKNWLKERLKLDISEEKSSITDIRKSNTEFLGFRMKAHRKKKRKWIISSHLTEKAIDHTKSVLRDQIRKISKNRIPKEIYLYNRIVAGLQNYYKIATQISQDFSKIGYAIEAKIAVSLRDLLTKHGTKSMEYFTRYGGFTGHQISLIGEAVYPISAVRTKPPYVYNQDVCNYTKTGREIIHTRLGFLNKEILNHLKTNPNPNESIEYNDNRLSKYTAQLGRCAITRQPLNLDMKVHRIIPKEIGGTDEYKNLVILCREAYILIHATDKRTIDMYRTLLNLNSKALQKVNSYRKKIGNEIV